MDILEPFELQEAFHAIDETKRIARKNCNLCALKYLTNEDHMEDAWAGHDILIKGINA